MAATRLLPTVTTSWILLSLAAIVFTPTPGSAQTAERQTVTVAGAGRATAGGAEFHLALLGVERDGGAPGGEIHYWRAPAPRRNGLAFVAKVQCLWVSSDLGSAALAGPVVDVREDPGGSLAQDAWVVVTVRERSVGDQLRVEPSSAPPSGSNCGASSSFGGAYRDGGVAIRAW